MRQRIVETGLIIGGLAFLSWSGLNYFRYQSFQSRTPLILKAEKKTASAEDGSSYPVIGSINVRRLGMSVSMVEGDDDGALELAAGHMPGTAQAGQVGNMVVAGHRDSAFWPLRNIRSGDQIEVVTNRLATYRVQSTRVVSPDEVRELNDTRDAVLTLVTCYPFRHVGPAPKRFIVRATLLP